jgi:hypothetical protein
MLMLGFKELRMKLNPLEKNCMLYVGRYLAVLRKGGTKNFSMCVINA